MLIFNFLSFPVEISYGLNKASILKSWYLLCSRVKKYLWEKEQNCVSGGAGDGGESGRWTLSPGLENEK